MFIKLGNVLAIFLLVLHSLSAMHAANREQVASSKELDGHWSLLRIGDTVPPQGYGASVENGQLELVNRCSAKKFIIKMGKNGQVTLELKDDFTLQCIVPTPDERKLFKSFSATRNYSISKTQLVFKDSSGRQTLKFVKST